MRVVARQIDPPAALVLQDDNAVLFIRVGILAPSVIAFLDRLLSVVRIK